MAASRKKKSDLRVMLMLIFAFFLASMYHFRVRRQQGDTRYHDLMIHDRIDETSCVSRYEYDALSRKRHRKPSEYLLSKLKNYEARHKRCGPYTGLYNKSLSVLKGDDGDKSSLECRYVIHKPLGGLGNRMISIVSIFIYALLTDRVLLIDHNTDFNSLFCEPFSETSWLLPSDFDLKSALKVRKSIEKLFIAPSAYDQGDIFFCDEAKEHRSIPWLVIETDQYLVPSFFMIPRFQQQLDRLFPEKELVFHLMGRYLYHPNDFVWGHIRRFYEAYLSKADVKVGIQLRIFDPNKSSKSVFEQVISCTTKEGILPEIVQQQHQFISSTTTTAVLITSLMPTLYQQMRNLFWSNPTPKGQIVAVHQPSYEGIQRTGEIEHDVKALAEIYLLSLTDKLVTSSMSTFGYVAQGIGGMRPWIMNSFVSENEPIPDPPCLRTMSMEPCHHFPPSFNCSNMKERLMDMMTSSYMMRCEDMRWGGIKLIGK